MANQKELHRCLNGFVRTEDYLTAVELGPMTGAKALQLETLRTFLPNAPR